MKGLIVPASLTVREAMEELGAVRPQILVLAAEENRLAGTLTDGDVRRFLLDGGRLDSPAVQAANPNPACARTRREAKTIYRQRGFAVVPLINERREVTGVFVAKGGTPAKDLHIPVVINAGGKGSRLDPFTRILPKPLIPVGDLPVLEHIMRQFQAFGCGEFHIIVNYKRQLMKAYFAECERKYQIQWYDEERPLGTGGGLSLLRGALDGTFFFTNCDILVRSDYEQLLRFHQERRCAVTMVCARKKVTIPYGVIELDEGGGIASMREKPELDFLTNTGMYVAEAEILEDIEPDAAIGFPDIIAGQMAKGRKAAAFPVEEDDWLDMGQMEELKRMEERLYEV